MDTLRTGKGIYPKRAGRPQGRIGYKFLRVWVLSMTYSPLSGQYSVMRLGSLLARYYSSSFSRELTWLRHSGEIRLSLNGLCFFCKILSLRFTSPPSNSRWLPIRNIGLLLSTHLLSTRWRCSSHYNSGAPGPQLLRHKIQQCPRLLNLAFLKSLLKCCQDTTFCNSSSACPLNFNIP